MLYSNILLVNKKSKIDRDRDVSHRCNRNAQGGKKRLGESWELVSDRYSSKGISLMQLIQSKVRERKVLRVRSEVCRPRNLQGFPDLPVSGPGISLALQIWTPVRAG